MKRLLLASLLVSLAFPTGVAAETTANRLYVDMIPHGLNEATLRITPVYDATHYHILMYSAFWPKAFNEDGEVGEGARQADELLLNYTFPETLEGYSGIVITLYRDGAVVAQDTVNYWTKNVTEEENENFVVILSPYVSGSLTILPNTVQGNLIVATADENRLPPTEVPIEFEVGSAAFVVHTSAPLEDGTVSLILKDPEAPTAVGYRERTSLQGESRLLQLLGHDVAPQGVYTNYVGPGAYVPVEGTPVEEVYRVFLPAIMNSR